MRSKPQVLNNAQNAAKLKEAWICLSEGSRERKGRNGFLTPHFDGPLVRLWNVKQKVLGQRQFWATQLQWHIRPDKKVMPEEGPNKGLILPFIEWESFVWQCPGPGNVLLKFPASVAIGNLPKMPLLGCEINDLEGDNREQERRGFV